MAPGRKIVFGLTLALSSLVSVALAQPKQINWDMLAPNPVSYENPFADLSSEQLRDLRTILSVQSAAGETTDAELPDEAVVARLRLEGQGLDVEQLFRQREIIMEARLAAAASTVPEHLGQSVRIPGYILPLEILDGKATDFLLVPTVGACIHTPPPPPNQMIHVSYPQGFEISGLYTPVWISGTLNADFRTQRVAYSDGQSEVEVSYVMQADVVTNY